ncbi:MAG: hypothetical protein QXR47_05920 [Candidatus Caldarchaeum sp.]
MTQSRRLLLKSLAGLAASMAVTLCIIWLFNIPLTSLLTTPLPLLLLSIVICMARHVVQGLRLYLLVKRHSKTSFGLVKALVTRNVSEFFALTTIPFLADELVRVWILVEVGERPATAFWIAFSELILDVLVGSPIAMLAGLAALAHGDIYLAAILLIISVTQLALTIFLIMLPKLQSITRFGLMERFSIPDRFLAQFKDFIRESSNFLTEFRSGWSKAVPAALLALTLAVMMLPAATLYLVFSSYGSISFVEAVYAFHAGNALGVLPVMVGGSGLTEAGIYLFSSRILAIPSWSAVVIWRILTYYLSLLVSGITLVFYTFWRARRLLSK